ncbi:MAG: glycosyltransferase family 4 protein, partial [Dethiobacteria bacterium]|nr:glycosyltransferase family 4 protein [Dethiobacteria bacterium]
AGLGSSLIRFRGDLIESWLGLGYEVVAAAPGREVRQQLTEMGVTYYSIPLKRTSLNPLTDIILTCSLIGIIKKEKPAYLFLYTVKPVIYGSLASQLNRKVKVYSMITGLGYVFSGKPGKRTFLETLVTRLYGFALKWNKLVFFQNPDDRNAFINLNIVSANRALQINGSGVNVDYFSPINLPNGPPVFLLIARLLSEKGIIEFIEAARVTKNKYPEVRFSMVGWSFDENPSAISTAQVEKWQAEGVVEIYGETDDVRPYIAAASVYVLPSYREGTPRTVLEAMAMGRPIITTDVPGCRETVVNGVNGFLVPVRDSEALAKAMERFIAEPKLIAQMGAESRRIAEEKYDVYKVNKVINEAMGLG